jgi:hypothetical protein
VLVHLKRFLWSILVVTLVMAAEVAFSKNPTGYLQANHTPTVGNAAIDTVDIEWWDDNKTLLFIDITFNFPISVTTDISDKAQKTHVLQLITPGTVAKSYKRIYRGTEHHVIPARFRDFVDEVRYEGGNDGKANLVLYFYEPTVVTYRLTNDLRTVHLEISRLQETVPTLRPAP